MPTPRPPSTAADRRGAPKPGMATSDATAWYGAPRAVFSGGNEVRLLTGGDELFPAMHEAISRAHYEVWLATYIFHDDEAGQAMAEVLAAAARRGVRVRVVVDGFGSKPTLPTLAGWWEGTPVALAVFRPLDHWQAWLQPGQLRRLHQKLCVVDGAVGFVGGINIIDDRNDLHHGRSDTPRLDYAVELRGPVVQPIAQTARAVWTRAAFGQDWPEELLTLARSTEPVMRLRTLLGRVRMPRGRPAPLPEPVLPPVRAAFLVRDNLRQRRAIERSYIDALRRARERVDLVSPYFYPGGQFRHALRNAARRGVRVRLLLQGKLDYRIAGLAASVLYDELLSHGVRIFEYTPAFLHAKVGLVDDDWATVGSSNIDPLSLLLNLEANVVVSDAPFVERLAQAFDAAAAASREVVAPPQASGAYAVLKRAFVATMAHWYLRMAGITGRY